MNTVNDISFSTLRIAQPLSMVGQVMAITHHVQRETLGALTADNRYKKLSLNFSRYVSSLAEGCMSPGELATKLTVSKQACSKTLRELESLGLIERRSNPQDGRSSLVCLTEQGLQLVQDGIAANDRIQREFAAAIGSDGLAQLVDELETVCRGLAIAIPRFDALQAADNDSDSYAPSRLNVLLFSLNNYCYQFLIDDLDEKGFSSLKTNYSQVLGLIGTEGGRIQTIASLVGVSKQAIAALATELEQLGYLFREPDPRDRRQVVLCLSPLGQRLLDESAVSIERLTAAIDETLGGEPSRHFHDRLATLCQQIASRYDSGLIQPGEIENLCQQLVQRLGSQGARALAQQLLVSTKEVA